MSKTTQISLTSDGCELYGELLEPRQSDTIALIVAGFGPIDRNGNQPNERNGSLKHLAQALALMGCASIRYDKRGIGASSFYGLSESELSFDDYINDAKNWVRYIAARLTQYKHIVLIGLGEGALITSLIATMPCVDKMVMIAASSLNRQKLLRLQLSSLPEPYRGEAISILDSLAANKPVAEVSESLSHLFRPSVQPYLRSLFRYEPVDELARVNVPILLVYGDNDLEIGELNGLALESAQPKAQYCVIKGMNHVLRTVGEDYESNRAAYNNPEQPLALEFVRQLRRFMQVTAPQSDYHGNGGFDENSERH